MSQILVRDLDKKIVDKLKAQAKKNGRSLQAEVRLILENEANAPKVDMDAARKLIDEIREDLKGKQFPDSAELIREDRDR